MDLPERFVGTEREAVARSVLTTLSRPQKSIEPRWLYDDVGAKLFEAITKLDHYYPTRTEMALIEAAAGEIAAALGEGVAIVEPGSGEALKVRPILDALGERAAAYVPIDIAGDQLGAVAGEMAALYPLLKVMPVTADFFQPFTMPAVDNAVVFFPGSTIGNMAPEAGAKLLRQLQNASGAGRFLIGFDLDKDRGVLRDAYDDPAGVSAAFAKNVLQRMNRELSADFDLSAFSYRAQWCAERSAVAMMLVSAREQTVRVAGHAVHFAAGETLHTEDSVKFTVEGFADFAGAAGLAAERTWTDENDYFALMLLRVR